MLTIVIWLDTVLSSIYDYVHGNMLTLSIGSQMTLSVELCVYQLSIMDVRERKTLSLGYLNA